MKKKYVLVHQEFLCPICVNHPEGDWIVNFQLGVGEKAIPVDIHIGGIPQDFTKRALGEALVPTLQFFEEEVFMNRRVWTCKHIAIGSYDVYGNYKFKKEMLNIFEV